MAKRDVLARKSYSSENLKRDFAKAQSISSIWRNCLNPVNKWPDILKAQNKLTNDISDGGKVTKEEPLGKCLTGKKLQQGAEDFSGTEINPAAANEQTGKKQHRNTRPQKPQISLKKSDHKKQHPKSRRVLKSASDITLTTTSKNKKSDFNLNYKCSARVLDQLEEELITSFKEKKDNSMTVDPKTKLIILLLDKIKSLEKQIKDINGSKDKGTEETTEEEVSFLKKNSMGDGQEKEDSAERNRHGKNSKKDSKRKGKKPKTDKPKEQKEEDTKELAETGEENKRANKKRLKQIDNEVEKKEQTNREQTNKEQEMTRSGKTVWTQEQKTIVLLLNRIKTLEKQLKILYKSELKNDAKELDKLLQKAPRDKKPTDTLQNTNTTPQQAVVESTEQNTSPQRVRSVTFQSAVTYSTDKVDNLLESKRVIQLHKKNSYVVYNNSVCDLNCKCTMTQDLKSNQLSQAEDVNNTLTEVTTELPTKDKEITNAAECCNPKENPNILQVPKNFVIPSIPPPTNDVENMENSIYVKKNYIPASERQQIESKMKRSEMKYRRLTKPDRDERHKYPFFSTITTSFVQCQVNPMADFPYRDLINRRETLDKQRLQPCPSDKPNIKKEPQEMNKELTETENVNKKEIEQERWLSNGDGDVKIDKSEEEGRKNDKEMMEDKNENTISSEKPSNVLDVSGVKVIPVPPSEGNSDVVCLVVVNEEKELPNKYEDIVTELKNNLHFKKELLKYKTPTRDISEQTYFKDDDMSISCSQCSRARSSCRCEVIGDISVCIPSSSFFEFCSSSASSNESVTQKEKELEMDLCLNTSKTENLNKLLECVSLLKKELDLQRKEVNNLKKIWSNCSSHLEGMWTTKNLRKLCEESGNPGESKPEDIIQAFQNLAESSLCLSTMLNDRTSNKLKCNIEDSCRFLKTLTAPSTELIPVKIPNVEGDSELKQIENPTENNESLGKKFVVESSKNNDYEPVKKNNKIFVQDVSCGN